MTIVLRDYQSEDAATIYAKYRAGIRRQVINQATGLGKTTLAAHIMGRAAGRCLFLAPLREVVVQSWREVTRMVPNKKVGMLNGDRKDYASQVVVASVQTAQMDKHLALLKRWGTFDVIVVDECHLNLDGYTKVVDELADKETLVLGLSATPVRGDGRGLDTVFDQITVNRDLIWGITNGHLAPITVKHIYVEGLDLNRVKVRSGDLAPGELESYMEAANYREHFADDWFAHASNRRTAVFLPKVEMAYSLADYMRSRGVTAAALDGGGGYDVLGDDGNKKRLKGMAKEKRAEVLRDFRSGKLQMLINVACLVAGWDCPPVDCIAMLRPTKSYPLLWQAIGRGTRKSPETGKTDCLVLDVVGAVECNKLQRIEDLIGVDKVKDGEDLLVAKARGAQEREEKEQAEKEERERLEAEHKVRQIEIMKQQEAIKRWQNDVLKPPAELVWQPMFGGNETLKVKVERTYVLFAVRPMPGGKAFVSKVSAGADLKHFNSDWSAISPTVEKARELCERYARDLQRLNAQPATAKQIETMKKFRMSVPRNCSKAEASRLLEEKFEWLNQRKAHARVSA